MTRAACTFFLFALLTPAAHAAETADGALPPALAEALAEVEPAALDELVREAKAAAARKAEEKAAAAALAAAEEQAAAEAKVAAEARAEADRAAQAKVLAAAKEEAAAAALAASAAARLAESKAAEVVAAQVAAPGGTESTSIVSLPSIAPEPALAPAADAKLAAVLAELDGQPRPAVETPTLPSQAGVNPLARAVSVFLIALVLAGFLLLHPAGRRALMARLTKRPAAALEAEGFVVRARHSLGTGQALVDLELDGVRLLVGVSPARMDVLHTWAVDASLADAVTVAPAAALLARAVAQEEAAAQAPRTAARAPLAAEPPPSVDQLLEAWKGTVIQQAAPADAFEDPAAEAPWWLEGASSDEKARIEQAAAKNAADEVLARMRSLDVPLSDRTGVGTDATKAPPKPAAAERKAVARANTNPGDSGPSQDGRSRGRALGTLVLLGMVLLPALVGADTAFAEDLTNSPALAVSLDGAGAGTSTAVKLLMTLTLMAVAPAIMLSMTSFTRLIVVFSLLRQAVGVQQAPPNQVLVGLALFLTWFVMGPTFEQVNDLAVAPYTAGDISEGEAVTAAMGPMRDFMMANTREADLALFIRLSGSGRPETRADVPTNALVPAFLISELKTAFQIGFLIYIPFLIIDVVVSTVLLAMGMMVLPPVVISLPFKLLLFVFVDGWNLLVSSMVQSFA